MEMKIHPNPQDKRTGRAQSSVQLMLALEFLSRYMQCLGFLWLWTPQARVGSLILS